MHIRNPVEWSVDQLRLAGHAVDRAGHPRGLDLPAPAVRRIGYADIREVLERGLDDFAAFRSDVGFLCVVYPLAGLVLARLAFGYDLLPLVFPLISGFALIGPIAAVGLYEMSRKREEVGAASWADAFDVFRSPSLPAIVGLGVVLLVSFLLWLAAAMGIYNLTLGPESPNSIGAFLRDVFTTARGWAMIVIGCGVGFLFALLVLSISVVSFPLLLDREVSLGTAVMTSLRAVAANPGAMALWGLVVAGLLVLGSIPALLGLIDVAAKLPGSRILDGQFTAVQQAVGTPKKNAAGFAFLRDFVEESKKNGLVASLIERHGAVGRLSVAPPA